MPRIFGCGNCLTWSVSNDCKNVSSQPTWLFCGFCWHDFAGRPLLAATICLFFQSLSSNSSCSCFEVLSITRCLCHHWRSEIQHVSAPTFCSLDNIFTQRKRKCGPPNNLCECAESPSTLSTKTSIEWNIYMLWSNLSVFLSELNFGCFFNHQDNSSKTDRWTK